MGIIMIKKWKAMRKKTALLLSVALLAGMAAGNDSGIGTVHAAGNTPSVTSFATKEELKTRFDCDGVDDTVGRLRFGKNAYGEPQIWYIVGTDSGVAAGDNIVLFAAEPISGKSNPEDGTTLDGSKFTINSDEQRAYDTAWNCQYSDNPTLSQVNRNYYGGSDLRVKLQEIAKSESYFTIAEQNLMNETTITTWDTLNEKTYTTTDKLYALSIKDVNTCYIGEDLPNNITKIYAGSGNNIEISSEVYLVDPPSSYWLRTPLGHKYNAGVGVEGHANYLNVAIVTTRGVVSYTSSGGTRVVKPAANLNLTNVLFASAAKAASQEPVSGTIGSEAPMVLRLNENAYGKAIGTVGYDATQGLIVAQKDAGVTGSVSLVVQGNDGTNDWYYSVVVDGSAVVTTEQLKKALNLSAVTLGDCRIWLETTEDNVSYATALAAELTQTEQVTKKPVTEVELTGVKPVGGTTLAANAACHTAGIAETTPVLSYTTVSGADTAAAAGIAGWDTAYKASVTLHTAFDGNQAYVFADQVAVRIDGEDIGNASPDAYGRLLVTQDYTTDKRKIAGVDAPAIPGGAVFSNYYTAADVLTDGGNGELGTQADVTLEGTAEVAQTQLPMDVEWTLDGGSDYDAAPGAVNTFRWTVKSYAYQDYDTDNHAMTGTCELTNRAATPVSITGTDGSLCFDGTDIDVSGYFTIDANAGAATYSLEAGGTGAGTLDGTTLTVTQTGTFLIKVSTAAVGIYAAGEKTVTLTVSDGGIVSTAADYSGIYDGQPHSITVSVTEPSDAAVTYSADGAGFTAENPTFTEAGSYTVDYKIEKENYTAVTGTKTVTIEKRDIEIKAEDQSLLWGEAPDQTKYMVSTVSGSDLAQGDHIADITLTPSTSERTENGTLTVDGVRIENAVGGDVTDSYRVSISRGVLKITHNPTLAPDRLEAVKTKTTYKEGDVLNLDDLTVTAYYADGYSENVTGYTTNAEGIDMSVPGTKILTVSFTQNGATRTKDIVLTVDALPPVQYTITATAGENGSITPEGTITVTQGDSQTFTILPASGYEIDTLTVDGSAVAAGASYTFFDIAANHSISVTFKPQPPVNVEYKIIDGANSTFTLGEDESLTLRVDAELGKFIGVEMDGKTVAPANYTAWSGSTYVRFTKDYMNGLTVGTHTVKILFSDGYATTAVTIARNEAKDDDTEASDPVEEITVHADNAVTTSPKTGDSLMPAMVYAAVMAICGAALVGFSVIRRKEHD